MTENNGWTRRVLVTGPIVETHERRLADPARVDALTKDVIRLIKEQVADMNKRADRLERINRQSSPPGSFVEFVAIVDQRAGTVGPE